MNEILLEAFRHSAWATRTLVAACRELSIEQLQEPGRGFGSILATLNHRGGPQISDSMLRCLPPFEQEDRSDEKETELLS